MNQNYEQQLKNIIFEVIAQNKIQVFLFGSRATKTARSRSDIDIALSATKPISSSLISLLKEKIEESTIPYHVDIVDLNTVSQTFRNKVLTEGKLWTA